MSDGDGYGGYALVMSPCVGCDTIFAYNPHVPSVKVRRVGEPGNWHWEEDPVNGQREPICQSCIERVNPVRIANGLPPFEPHPDAYKPVRESELEG